LIILSAEKNKTFLKAEDKMKNYNKFSEDSIQELHSVKGVNSQCIYCGNFANTREHIPSKILLNEPLPNNLMLVPACESCNKGFSSDEIYFAYIVEYLASKYYGYKISGKIQQCFESNLNLQNRILFRDKSNLIIDDLTVKKILRKYALGHISYIFDTYAYRNDYTVIFKFITELSEEQKREFNTLESMEVMPELGCRGCQELLVSLDGQSAACLWNEVQENRYRYMVCAKADSILVKIIINEYLYAKIIIMNN
jgi:hypothetical protein